MRDSVCVCCVRKCDCASMSVCVPVRKCDFISCDLQPDCLLLPATACVQAGSQAVSSSVTPTAVAGMALLSVPELQPYRLYHIQVAADPLQDGYGLALQPSSTTFRSSQINSVLAPPQLGWVGGGGGGGACTPLTPRLSKQVQSKNLGFCAADGDATYFKIEL